jgi:hypothetical protein
MPSRPMRHACRKIVAPSSSVWSLIAVAQGPRAEVLTVELQKVEGVQHGLGDGAAAVQSIEDCDAIWTADHGFSVEGERLAAQ